MANLGQKWLDVLVDFAVIYGSFVKDILKNEKIIIMGGEDEFKRVAR